MHSSTTKFFFERAVSFVSSAPTVPAPFLFDPPSNTQKLEFYAFYKQATVGKCNTSKPGFFDVAGRYKWDAWNKLGDMSKEAAMQGYISAAMPLLKQLASLSEAQIDAYLATSIAPEERRQVGVLFKQVKAFVRDVSHYQASGRSPLTSDDEEHFSFDDMDSPKSYSSSNSEDHTPTSLQLSQNLIELPSPAAVDANSETASARDGVESEGGGGIPSIPDSPGSHASLSSNALLSRAEEAVRGDKTGEEGTVQELAAVSVSAVLTRLDQMMARIEAIEKRVQGLERGEGKWSRQASFFLCALIVALPVAVKLWHEANGRRKRFI